jgi:predicted Zn-dependent protease
MLISLNFSKCAVREVPVCLENSALEIFLRLSITVREWFPLLMGMSVFQIKRSQFKSQQLASYLNQEWLCKSIEVTHFHYYYYNNKFQSRYLW